MVWEYLHPTEIPFNKVFPSYQYNMPSLHDRWGSNLRDPYTSWELSLFLNSATLCAGELQHSSNHIIGGWVSWSTATLDQHRGSFILRTDGGPRGWTPPNINGWHIVAMRREYPFNFFMSHIELTRKKTTIIVLGYRYHVCLLLELAILWSINGLSHNDNSCSYSLLEHMDLIVEGQQLGPSLCTTMQSQSVSKGQRKDRHVMLHFFLQWF